MMVPGESADDAIALREYLAVLWRRRVVAVALTAAVTLFGAALSFVSPRVFESEAIIHLGAIQVRKDGPIVYVDSASIVAALTSPAFIEAVARDAGVRVRVGALTRMVRVGTAGDGRLVRLRVQHTDGALAQRLNAALIRAVLTQVASQVQQTREAVEGRLREVDTQLAETDRILRLSRDMLVGLETGRAPKGAEGAFTRSYALSAMSTAGAVLHALHEARRDLELELIALQPPVVIAGPTLPSEPVAPRTARNIILAGLLGAIAGVATAFLVEYFKPSRPTEETVRVRN